MCSKAGAAGLAAIIGSRPFDLPSWLPVVLDLAATLVDYPAPVSKIVIKGTYRARYARVHFLDLFSLELKRSMKPPHPSLPSLPLLCCASLAFDSFWTSHRSTWASASNVLDPQQMQRLAEVFERIRSNVLCA
jgi:hypothetical protein